MFEDKNEMIRQELHDMELEHRALDSAVHALGKDTHADQLQIQRLKKRKLELKDRINRLQSKLIPDLDA